MAEAIEKSAELEYWEAAAKERPYDAICAGFTKETFENKRVTLADRLKLDKNMIFLDLCCGIGRIAKWVAPQVKQYVGFDFSENMISQARAYNHDLKNVYFEVNGNGKIPSGSDSIDACVCEIAFQHMHRDTTRKYIKEVLRVLKPGGQFISHVPVAGRYSEGFLSVQLPGLLEGFDYTLLAEESRGGAYFVPLAVKKEVVKNGR